MPVSELSWLCFLRFIKSLQLVQACTRSARKQANKNYASVHIIVGMQDILQEEGFFEQKKNIRITYSNCKLGTGNLREHSAVWECVKICLRNIPIWNLPLQFSNRIFHPGARKYSMVLKDRKCWTVLSPQCVPQLILSVISFNWRSYLTHEISF